MTVAQDQYDELHPDPDDGEPVDYDPFPEDRLGEAVQTLERLVRMIGQQYGQVHGRDKPTCKILDALTAAINAPREVVRDENGKIDRNKGCSLR